METLNKSILDFSAVAGGKHGLPPAHKINDLRLLILAASPGIAGIADLIGDSLSTKKSAHF